MILKILTLLSIVFLAIAQYWGLVIAPPDRMMGDLYRILFVHVPMAWMTMLFFFFSFIGSLSYLMTKNKTWDFFAESTAEIGLVLNGLALALGSLWGKPVWGVWWTWDPRLTTTALLCIMYAGYLMVRQLIDDPDKRSKIAAGMGLLIFINVPIVYMSVRWWRSLHQIQSSPSTMAPEMVLPLRLNAFALLGICLILLTLRMRVARKGEQIENRENIP